MAKSKVAILRTKPETVIEDYIKLGELAGLKDSLKEGATTIIKDNISWELPMPSANTTPWQLEGCILALQKNGFKDNVCVQNKTVVTDANKGERLNKYLPVFEKYNLPVLYNYLPKDMTWERYEPKARMRILHKIFPEGIKIPDYFKGKNIVHLPTVKCHIYTTTTGAIKNAFGGLLNVKRHYTHSWIHETICDLLAIQKEIHTGLFAFMDGTSAGNGPGPRTMMPVEKNIIIASQDQVAIDAVAAKLMGFDPLSIPYIRFAQEDGLGTGDIKDIEIVGDSEVINENWNFSVGDNTPSRAGDFIWFGPLKPIQKLFFHTPLVYSFIYASFVYHNHVWWPLYGEKIFQCWLKNSQWGKLFEKY